VIILSAVEGAGHARDGKMIAGMARSGDFPVLPKRNHFSSDQRGLIAFCSISFSPPAASPING